MILSFGKEMEWEVTAEVGIKEDFGRNIGGGLRPKEAYYHQSFQRQCATFCDLEPMVLFQLQPEIK